MNRRLFFALLGLYFAARAFLRALVSDSLELDEAEQILFAQWFQWGYSHQPPLYTWLLKPLLALPAPPVLVLALLKNALLFLTFAFTFLSAQRITKDEGSAALAALGLFLMPPLAWESMRDLTHSVLAGALVAANFLVVLQMLGERTTPRYGLFGLTLGLGMLSKPSFAIHGLTLPAALLTTPEGRAILRDRRLLAALAISGALIAPHGWWMAQHPDAMAPGLHKLMLDGRADSCRILLKLALNAAGYVGPLLLAAVCLSAGAPRTRPPASAGRKVLVRYFLVLAALLPLLVCATGVGRIRTRWLFPFAVPFPLLVAAVWLPASNPRRGRVFTGLAALSALGVVLAFLFRVRGAAWTRRPTELNLPIAEVVRDLKSAGFARGLVVGADSHLAGNLRLQFGDAYPTFAPRVALPLPARSTNDTLVIWDATDSARPPADLVRFARDRLATDIAALPAHIISRPYRYGAGENARLGYVLLHGWDAPAPGAKRLLLPETGN